PSRTTATSSRDSPFPPWSVTARRRNSPGIASAGLPKRRERAKRMSSGTAVIASSWKPLRSSMTWLWTSSTGPYPRLGPMSKTPPRTLRQAGRTELVTLVTTDYSGITRGRSMPQRDFERARGGAHCGWVPANMSLTPFDVIPERNPWGSKGDLRLMADPHARYRVWPQGAETPLDFVMCDIVEPDGESWTCCPRSMLKRALADFEAETGCQVIAAFEQEFQLLRTGWPSEPSFSLSGLRRADPFGPDFMAALDHAGCEPEMFIREFGGNQYEITHRPAPGLVAADRAVAVRRTARGAGPRPGW